MSDKTAPDRLWYDIGYAATAGMSGKKKGRGVKGEAIEAKGLFDV